MNRNSEQHYNQVPHANVPRARFKRDYSLLTTMNEGDLVPIYCDEVLPADTAKIDLNALMRMSTPLYPVMDNCYCDFYFFFVPSRLLWEHFENLMGQNDSTFWAEKVDYTTPKTTAPTGGWKVGTLADYFGIPTGVENLQVNSLPFRAYAKIWNEWFRDENLQQPVTMSKTDATTAGSNTGTNLTDAEAGGLPLKVCKYKDYFTSCLPSPQKGETVKLPMEGNAPIYGYGTASLKEKLTGEDVGMIKQFIPYFAGENGDELSGAKTAQFYTEIDDSLHPVLGVDLSAVQATTINELRQAIAVQHIMERDARTGTRYKEILQGAWGVTSPDARLDRCLLYTSDAADE